MFDEDFPRSLPEDPDEAKRIYRDLYNAWRLGEADLKREEDENKFLKAALHHLPNPTFIKDEDTDFYFMNEAYEELFEIDQKMKMGRSSLDIDYQDSERRFTDQDEDFNLIDNQEAFAEERMYVLSDGIEHPCLYWATGFLEEETGEKGLVGEIVDITEQYQLRSELEQRQFQLQESFHNLEEQKAKVEKTNEELRKAKSKIEKASRVDPGTGLYNRYVFDDLTKELIEEAKTKDKTLCALMADLDHFKRVNDNFGHLEGDRVLKEFAKLIKKCTRAGDVAIRYGGEEFLVFLKGATLPMGKRVAERIRTTTESELHLPNGESMTVSIGLVKYNKEESRTECISRVDDALYMAKNTGRNKVVIFSDDREQIEIE